MRILTSAARVASHIPRGLLGGVSRVQPWHLCRALSSLPDHKILIMPKLSPTMEVGTILEWNKKVGDGINAGDSLVEIETDKATMSYEYNDDGFLAKIWLENGASDIAVGTPIGVVVEEEEDIKSFKDMQAPGGDASASSPPAADPPAPPAENITPAPTPVVAPPSVPTPSPAPTTTGRILASPLARHTASQAGISLRGITGTGPGGRVIAADVAHAVSSGIATKAEPESASASASAPATARSAPAVGAPSYEDIPVTKYKKVTAERLLMSKNTIPHYYLTVTVDMDALLEQRARLNAKGGDSYKLSVTDFIIKASAAALRAVPEVNASWQGDTIRQFNGADISVAVQTPRGLITPIVRGADSRGLRAISADVKELAARARDDKLTPEEFMGGTFTISNLGMFGTEQFCAIVNPPQAAILAVGTSVKNMVPADNEQGWEFKTQMKATLSCDHRVIDGAVGAQWLQAFKRCIEDPLEMLMD